VPWTLTVVAEAVTVVAGHVVMPPGCIVAGSSLMVEAEASCPSRGCPPLEAAALCPLAWALGVGLGAFWALGLGA